MFHKSTSRISPTQRLANERFDEIENDFDSVIELFRQNSDLRKLIGELNAKFSFFTSALRGFNQHRQNVSLAPIGLAHLARLIGVAIMEMQEILSRQLVLNYQAGRNLRAKLGHYHYCFIRRYENIGDAQKFPVSKRLKDTKLNAMLASTLKCVTGLYDKARSGKYLEYYAEKFTELAVFFSASVARDAVNASGVDVSTLQVFDELRMELLTKVVTAPYWIDQNHKFENLVLELKTYLATPDQATNRSGQHARAEMFISDNEDNWFDNRSCEFDSEDEGLRQQPGRKL